MTSQASFEIFSDRDCAHPKRILQEDRMQCLSSRLPGTLYLVGLFLTCLAPHLAAQGRRPGPVPLAAGGLQIINNTLIADTVPAESGPYNFTFTVKNTGTSSILVDETLCYDGVGQISCSTTPESFNLAPGATRLITGTYYTLGNGVFQITEWAANADHSKWASALGGPITVTGSAPIATNIHPLAGGPFYPWDTLAAALAHPSGVVTSSVRLLIDGIDKTSVATVTSSSVKATAQALSLGPGSHTWKTRACAVSGRCDTATTVFGNSAPLTFLLDDSLPEPIGYEPYGPFLGGLPLPPENLRGCATTTDHPEMLLSPGQVLPQANPEGWVFTAGILTTDTLTIVVQYGDHSPNDGWPTCESLTWAPGFAWDFWAGADTGSVLWDYYPYSDAGQLFGAARSVPQPFAQYAPRAAGPWRDRYGFPSLRGGTTTGGAKAVRGPVRRGAIAAGSTWSPHRGRGTTLKPPPGAIKFNSLQVSLNGVAIIANAVPVRVGVTINTAGFQGGQSGATIKVPPSDTLYHRRNDANPPAQQGGWNEVLASISDSTNHTTTVRSRFVSAAMEGAPASIAMTPLRDFRKVDMSECAAYGAFQCGGVMVVQTIPGYMTRDRVRDLHLVYRSGSQPAPVVLPHQVYIDPVQKAPDSMRVVPKVAGAAVGTATRYAGLLGSPGGKFVLPLADNMKEYRAVAAEANPAPGQAAIRTVTTEFTHYYPGAVVRTDTVSQQVVQLYLKDTTTTRFGPGWQLAELSRLVTGLSWQGVPALVWLDGDGSYSIFTKPGSAWVSPPGETATLVENAGAPSDSAYYTIRLDNGATIGFRSDGWQTWTSDLIGNRTQYTYTGTGVKRLQYITDPSGARFEFVYTATSGGRVDSIKVRPSGGTSRRAVTLKRGAGGRLDSLIVHWGMGLRDATGFAYASDTTAGYYLIQMRDPRDTPAKPVVTGFVYDSVLRSPTYLIQPPYNYGVQGQQLYRDTWRRAAPRVWYGRGSQPLERTVLMSQLRGTSVNPAGNATDYTADRFGHPTFVRRVAPAEVLDVGYWIDTLYRHDDRHIQRDSLGRVAKIVHARDSAGPTTDSVMYRYDSRNRLDRIIRNTLEYPLSTASLDTLTFVYDSVSISTTDNPGAWCYRLLSATDGAGGVTTTTYETSPTAAKCRPTLVIGVALDTTRFSYASGAFTKSNAIAGRPTFVRRPTGDSTIIAYHLTTWNTLSYNEPAKAATTTVYSSASSNGLGRPDSIIDPEGMRRVFWYDSLGRVRYQKGGSGTLAPTTLTKYGPGGLVSQTDVFANGSQDTIPATSPATQSTKYFYDRLGLTDSVVNPGGTRRIWYYNRGPYGAPGRTYAGNGTYTATVTDWQGRTAVSIQSPVLPGFSYDGAGYFADTYSSTRYNAAGALTNGQLSDGQSYTVGYDVKGRQVAAVHNEASGTMSIRRRGYSRTGQLLADTLMFPQAGFMIARIYRYNRRGQRIEASDAVQVLYGGVTLNGATAGKITYAYDNRARLDSVVASAGVTGSLTEFAKAKYTYGPGNRLSRLTVKLDGTGSTLTRAWSYDAAGRVTADSSFKTATTPFAVAKSITYNRVDDIVSLIRTTPAASGVGLTYTYSTDGTRRLVSEAPAGGQSTTWTYDVFGNRVKQATGSVDTSAHEATDNRLRYRRRMVGSNAHWYWHDHTGARIGSTDTLSGNATLDSRMTYTAAGQLAWSLHRNNPGDILSSFTSTWNWYDASGMREMTEVKQTGLGGYLLLYPGYGRQIYYFYDGTDVALIVERDSAGILTVAKRYVTGGLDRQLAVKNGIGGYVGSLAIISDHLGSVVGAMRSNGNLEGTVLSYTTNAYGEVTGTTGSGGTNLDVGFAGASTPDPKGGFTYMRNRWYDPQTGRFLTQDPIGLAGGVNLYSYAGNNPVSFDDPYGLCPWCIGAALGAAVAGTVQVAANIAQGQPVLHNLGQSLLVGAVVGGTFGAAAPEATAVFGARLAIGGATAATAGAAAGAGSQGQGVTSRIISGVQQAGGDMNARITAVARVIGGLPGQRVLMKTLEDGTRVLSGGAGERARQIILNPDGSTIVKAFNVAKETWEVVKEIKPQ